MKNLVFWIVVLAGAVVLIVAAMAVVVHVLWNALMPPICGFKEITFWQALGLTVLGHMLTGASMGVRR